MSYAQQRFGIIFCAFPMLNYGFVIAFWLFASLSIGHWVQPGINDPKDFFMGIPFHIQIFLMILSFALAPMAFAMGRSRKQAFIYLLNYCISLFISIKLFHLDLYQTTTWIAD